MVQWVVKEIDFPLQPTAVENHSVVRNFLFSVHLFFFYFI